MTLYRGHTVPVAELPRPPLAAVDVLKLGLRTFWSPCGRRNEVVGGLRGLLVTSRTSSWVVPPPKVVFYTDASSAYARKGCTARAPRVLSDRPSVETSTGFGGGFRATGCFVRGWAQGGQGARGLPRRRRLGARWEAFGKRLALVLGRYTQELEPTSGWSSGERMGLAAREGARTPVDTRGGPTAS